MRYVRLGQTDLKVSAIAFGTWAFGGDWGAAERYDSDAAIGRAWRPAYGTSAPTISTSTSSTGPTPHPAAETAGALAELVAARRR